MSKRILGRDLEVSSIGLGCMGMSHAYGRPSDKTEAKNLLAKAVDLGYTMFDTAEVYGTAENPHHNETLLGEILKPYRNQIKIATKGGLHFDENSTVVNKNLVPDSRPEVLKKSVEDSLQRLQMNHLDLYYIHRVDPTIPIEETAGVMKELIDQGKITHWGISEATEEIIRRAHKVCPLTAVQNRYSMMYRNYESLFPVLKELQIGFVAFSPLANGFLTCRYDEYSTFEKSTDYRSIMPQFRRNCRKSEAYRMAENYSSRKKCYSGSDFSGVDAGKKSVSCTNSGNKKSETSDRKYSGRIHSSVSRRSHRN